MGNYMFSMCIITILHSNNFDIDDVFQSVFLLFKRCAMSYLKLPLKYPMLITYAEISLHLHKLT